MSQRVSSSCDTVPTIFTDRWHSSNYLPCGILRFKNEDLLSSQVGEIIDDAEKFSVSIDARNFAPNEITVYLHKILLMKNLIFLSAKRKVNTEGNELKIGAIHVDSKGKKQFERRYMIPDNVVMECNETRISPDGILTITLFKKHLPS
ncbi:unnamed protein product [Wuchereria bancrofti]|uniref:SHSP domain-containing protein n=1 Tax=Wuchereria bancrofti TaxID=6293 RepID=A0A3P7ECC2_WUCBA|nr:unnamed protein product [Wuchereria bancrofti]